MPFLPPDLVATLTDLADATLTGSGAPGLGLSVFTPSEVVLERGFGLRDREARLPVTPGTIFGVASVTKSFTALTALALEERGLLSIGDDVRSYFDFGRLWSGGEAPRVEHFLSHTSGLPPTPTMTWLRYASQEDDPVAAGPTLGEAKLTLVPGVMGMAPVPTGSLTLSGLEAAAAALEDGEARSRLEALAALVSDFAGLAGWLGENAAPLAPPGGLYSYSNDAFCLAGAMVARAEGAPFATVVDREVLSPLGMRRSRFDLGGVLADPDHSTLYTKDAAGTVRRSPAWQTTGVMQGGGMLKSTLADLRVYVRHLMRGGPKVRAMTAPRVSSAPGAAYGLGLAINEDHHGLRVVKHGGSLKGVSSAIGFVPELGVGVVVLCNLDGVPAEQLLTRAINACAGLPLDAAAYEPEPFLAAAAPEAATSGPDGGEATPSAAAEPFLGEYLSGEPYGRLRLYRTASGELRAQEGWPKVDLPAFVAGPDEVALVYPERRAPVRLLRDEHDEVWGAQAGRVMRRLG